MNELQPCTYNQSKLLKKLGFNWYTQSAYAAKEFVDYLGWVNSWKMSRPDLKIPLETQKTEIISCPTTVIAVKWLRENKKAILGVRPTDDWDNWIFSVLFPDSWCPFFEPEIELIEYPTFEAAESAGLDFVLNHLPEETPTKPFNEKEKE